MRFFTIFNDQLRRRRAQIIGWGISLFILTVYIVPLYDSFASQQEQFASMLSAYPPELMAVFGGSADLFSVPGYLNFTYFSIITLVLGFWAVTLGANLLGADEERGRLDLVAAYPISRISLFSARLFAVVLVMAAVIFFSWLGFILTMPASELVEISAGEIALPHLELLALMIFFAGMSLLLSQILPSRSAATGLASGILLASFILQVLLELDADLADLERLSPLHYLKGGYAVEGLNLGWLLSLFGIGLLFIALAAWRFERRDLRVSGEGSWPSWARLLRRRGAGGINPPA